MNTARASIQTKLSIEGNYLTIKESDSGDLVLSLTEQHKNETAQEYKEYIENTNSYYIFLEFIEDILCNSEVEYCTADKRGHLSDADMFFIESTGEEWFYNDSALHSPLAKAIEGETVVFHKV